MSFCNFHGCDETEERPLLQPMEISDDSHSDMVPGCSDCTDATKHQRSLQPIEIAEEQRVSERIPPCYYDGEAILYFSNEVGPSIPFLWMLNMAMLLHEHQALRCALPPYVRDMIKYESYENALVLKMFDISFFSVPSTYWVCYCLIVTALDFADVITDVAYAGNMSFGGVDFCSKGNTTAIWIHWWRNSAFHFFGIPCIPLDALSLLALILSLFQTVIPLATMLRKESPDKPVSYARGDDGRAKSCLTGSDLYNDDVFFLLWEKLADLNLLKRWVSRNGVQLNLQSWVLVINKIQATSTPVMPILSVALSFFMTALKLLEVIKFISIWCRIEEIAKGASVPEEKRSDFDAKLSLFRRRGVAVVSAAIFLWLALCGVCVTLIGIGRCPSGIQTWHGCLHIEVDVSNSQ
eukprot:s2934_g21.t1